MAKIANCPQCKSFRSIQISNHQLNCTNCEFSLDILCAYCGVGKLSVDGDKMVYVHCQMEQNEEQLKYIIQNRLKVDMDHLCQYCNRPTLSKIEANIQPRCFNFPTCGNQTQLFEVEVPSHDLVFLDFETTGLEIGNESIIEVGACKVDRNGQEYFFQELVKPVTDIKPLITQITGIDNEMVKNAPSLKEVLQAFMEFCGSAQIIAHNAQFDVPWLVTSLMRHQFDVPFSQVLCTLKWAKTKEEGKRSLGALSKKYHIGHENAHRALADAVVTKSLFYIYDKDDDNVPFEPMDRYIDISKKIMAQFPDFIQS